MKTPYYSYDLDLLHLTIRRLLREAGKYKLHFAIKANADKRINSIVSDYGIGADCVSGNEILHALECGYDPRQIVFAGVGKTDEEIQIALEQNIACFNVESAQEVQVINRLAKRINKVATIAIRVNPNINAETHEYITTGTDENKFGISCEHLMGVIHLIEDSRYVQLSGLHFHIGSQILNLENFRDLAQKVNVILADLYDEGIDIQHINLGGGLGIDYQNPLGNLIPDFRSYFQLFRELLRLEAHQEVHFELGRSIVGQCGDLHTKVLYVKQGVAKQFAIVDAGMTDLLRPALYQASHEIVKLHSRESEQQLEYDIVGPICESSDVFRKSYSIEKLKRGDELVIKSVGAYGEVMTSNYNLRNRPGVFYKNETSMASVALGEELLLN